MLRSMKVMRLIRYSVGFVGGLLLLAVAGVGAALYLCMPSATETARIPGLSAPVAAAFDPDGIPHIRADTALDGAAALGWVHARDRMFQMELMRRAASGRVSEIAGVRAVPLDRTMRVLGLRHRAEAEWVTLPATTRDMLEVLCARE